jgi:reverse gyrase
MNDKKEQITEYLRDFHARLNEMFPTPELKNEMLSTFMGHSSTLVDFLGLALMRGVPLPDSIKYSMAIMAANFRAVSCREPHTKYDGELTFDVIPDETFEETCHRKLKKVIKLIYDSVIEEENEEAKFKKLAEDLDDGANL